MKEIEFASVEELADYYWVLSSVPSFFYSSIVGKPLFKKLCKELSIEEIERKMWLQAERGRFYLYFIALLKKGVPSEELCAKVEVDFWLEKFCSMDKFYPTTQDDDKVSSILVKGAGKAFMKARQEALEAGLSIIEVKDFHLVEVNKDGLIRIIKKLQGHEEGDC